MSEATTDDLDRRIRRARSHQLGDLLRRSARRYPNKLALSFRDHRDTYTELDEVVNRTANALSALGIDKGDRVAVFSHNNRAFVILRFAMSRIGAVTTPVNFMLNAEDVAYILEHSQAAAVIAEDSLCATMDQAMARLAQRPAIRLAIAHTGVEPSTGWSAVEPLFDYADASEPWVEVASDDPIQLMYTSGTESRPKGATLTTTGLYGNYVTAIVDGDMDANAIELHCLPLFHCAQLDCFLTPDLYLGATSILHDGADPAAMLATIEKERVTKLFCPPTVWIALLRHPDFDTCDLSSLSQGYYGASIMPTAIIEELCDRLPNIKLYNLYGQTEIAPIATVLRPEDQLRKLGSAGRPAVNVETRVVNDAGDDVPVGEVGEIVHRSAQLIVGYFNNPEKTDEAFAGGWFHSGDLGRFDEEGFLYVVDRKKDMIKTGGENVASREVEEAIFRHPAVAEVAVFGVPHPTWIEAVTAAVVLKSGAAVSAEEISDFCRRSLTPFKAPKHVALVEQLPKNASGKILKRDLRLSYDGLFK